MRLEANNLRRVQSKGPNGWKMNEVLANPPGLGNIYLAIPAGLQGNETVANIADSSNGVQTGSTTSGQVQPTNEAAGGQN